MHVRMFRLPAPGDEDLAPLHAISQTGLTIGESTNAHGRGDVFVLSSYSSHT
jgi:hypothetical protein